MSKNRKAKMIECLKEIDRIQTESDWGILPPDLTSKLVADYLKKQN